LGGEQGGEEALAVLLRDPRTFVGAHLGPSVGMGDRPHRERRAFGGFAGEELLVRAEKLLHPPGLEPDHAEVRGPAHPVAAAQRQQLQPGLDAEQRVAQLVDQGRSEPLTRLRDRVGLRSARGRFPAAGASSTNSVHRSPGERVAWAVVERYRRVHKSLKPESL
jgi:hypothetical protein